jgi:hypothetical protein
MSINLKMSILINKKRKYFIEYIWGKMIIKKPSILRKAVAYAKLKYNNVKINGCICYCVPCHNS